MEYLGVLLPCIWLKTLMRLLLCVYIYKRLVKYYNPFFCLSFSFNSVIFSLRNDWKHWFPYNYRNEVYANNIYTGIKLSCRLLHDSNNLSCYELIWKIYTSEIHIPKTLATTYRAVNQKSDNDLFLSRHNATLL